LVKNPHPPNKKTQIPPPKKTTQNSPHNPKNPNTKKKKTHNPNPKKKKNPTHKTNTPPHLSLFFPINSFYLQRFRRAPSGSLEFPPSSRGWMLFPTRGRFVAFLLPPFGLTVGLFNPSPCWGVCQPKLWPDDGGGPFFPLPTPFSCSIFPVIFLGDPILPSGSSDLLLRGVRFLPSFPLPEAHFAQIFPSPHRRDGDDPAFFFPRKGLWMLFSPPPPSSSISWRRCRYIFSLSFVCRD